MLIRVFTDGGARGAPGPASAGAALYDADDTLIGRAGLHLGETTVNVAEWQAVLLGLREAQRLGATEVELFSDSELVIRQFTGQYSCHAAHLAPLRDEARSLADAFVRVSATHVPREQNKEADRITREVLAGTFTGALPTTTRDVSVSFSVTVTLDPRVAREQLANGADLKTLRTALADRVKAALPRCVSVGDSIAIKRINAPTSPQQQV